MSPLDTLMSRVEHHHGPLESVMRTLPDSLNEQQLRAIPDDRYLAEMAACIFRAGFVWRVVTNKWEGFEAVFNGFHPLWLVTRSPEQIEAMASDTRIIRNLSKVRAVVENALFVTEAQESHGSFAAYLCQWSPAEQVQCLAELKKRGSRLGGRSGEYFLRFMGKDGFILSRDVIRALQHFAVIDNSNVSSQRDLRAIQLFFNELHAESQLPYAHLSRLLALSEGP